MKKLVDLRCYVSVNGEEYCDTSIWKQWRYVDADAIGNDVEEVICDWSEAYRAVMNHRIRNAYTDCTFWKMTPRFCIKYGDLYRDDAKISKKDFVSLKYKWVAEEVNEVYNIRDLADRLPAEQFCEWVKDQGIQAISLNN